jgi:hypothetical protein
MPLNRHRDPVEQQHVVQTLSVHVESKPDPGGLSEWDQLVSSTPGTDVTQLSAWARVRAHVGYLPLYIFLREEGRLVGGVQLLHHDVLRMSRIGYVPYGPQGAAQSRFGWSWAGFGLLTQAEDGEEETWVVANLP